MTLSRVEQIAVRVLNAAFVEGKRILSVRLYRNGDEGSFVLCFRFEGEAPLARAAYVAIGMMQVGEYVISGSSQSAFSCTDTGPPNIVDDIKGIYRTKGFTSFDENDLCYCVRQNGEALNTDKFVGALQLSWLGCQSLQQVPKPELRAGAGVVPLPLGRATTIPVSANGRHYAVYRAPGNKEPLLRNFNSSEFVRAEKLSATRLALTLGIDAAEIYGVDFSCDIVFDLWTDQPLHVNTLWSDLRSFSTKSQLRDLVSEDVLREKKSSVQRIDARKSEAGVRKKLFIGGNFVGLVPTNEMETVILCCRLEPFLRSEFFGTFSIVEYTSREGIDSIVEYRKSDMLPATRVFTEFEFNFSSFFRHNHPLRQVELIICWNDDLVDGDHAFGSEQGSEAQLSCTLGTVGWKRSISSSGHTIPVIALRRLPNLLMS